MTMTKCFTKFNAPQHAILTRRRKTLNLKHQDLKKHRYTQTRNYMMAYEKENTDNLLQAIKNNDLDLLSKCNIPWYDIYLSIKIKHWDKQVKTVTLAAHNGFADCIQKLIEKGLKLSRLSTLYRIALLRAAEGGHNDCIRLLSRNALFLDEDVSDELSIAIETLDFQFIQNIAEQNGNLALNLIEEEDRRTNVMSYLILCGCPVGCLNSLFNLKIEINKRNRQGLTPLMTAVIADDIECVRWLLNNGAKVNMADKTKRSIFSNFTCYDQSLNDDKDDMVFGENKTALKYASILNRVSCVELLLDYGADVNLKDVGGFTALMHAANCKNYQCVEKILEFSSGKDLNINAVNNSYRTALILAAYSGDDKSARLLLKAKASRYLKDTLNRTALMAAVVSDSLECVKMLFEFQAEIDTRDGRLQTPLMNAAKSNNVDILKFLLERANSPLHLKRENANSILKEPLFCALLDNKLDSVALLLKHGADVNSTHSDWTTPLMVACKNKNTEMFYFLIENGANIQAVTKDFQNSVLLYALNLDIGCVSYLIKKGVNINKPNSSKQTPLMKACQIGRYDCVKLLLENGAILKINAKDRKNRTALMHAAEGRCVDCFKILLDSGADVDIVEEDHNTIFGYTIEYNCFDHFKLLVDSEKIFDVDGNVKKIHTNKFYRYDTMYSYIQRYNKPFLVTLIKLGVFAWNWFLKPSYNETFPHAVVMSGVSPGTFIIQNRSREYYNQPQLYKMISDYGLDPQLSPLKYAFLKVNLKLTQYLLANLYLTTEDYKFLVLDKTFQKKIGLKMPDDKLVQYCHHLTSQPWKLEILSFLSISTAITKITQGKRKGANVRCQIIDSLGLPGKFKTRLKFKGPMSTLCPSAWEYIGNPPWGKERQNILTLTTSIWPHPHLLVPCQQECCNCKGIGHVIQMNSSAWQ